MIFIRSRLVLAGMAAVGIALSGCAGLSPGRSREERESRLNVFPDNYKNEVLAAMRSYVTDPTNIRDAYITDPSIKQVGTRNRYAVCIRYNAKDGDGRYTGSKDIMAIFVNGRFDQFMDVVNQNALPGADLSEQVNSLKQLCGQADYRRFPELEVLKR